MSSFSDDKVDCWPIGFAGLAGVVASVGRADFGAALMAILDRGMNADMCSAFGVTDSPRLLLAESRDAEHSAFARIASLRYARRYWNHDTATLANLGRAHRNVLVTRRAGKSIRDLDYRLECYAEGDVAERLSILSAEGPVRLILNAYRVGEQPPFDGAEIDRISELAPFLMAALRRHQELTARDGPGRRDGFGHESALADRLRRAAPLLSLREAQILATLATGASEQEAAGLLGLGCSTVATYRRRGYAKLGVAGRRGLRALVADLS